MIQENLIIDLLNSGLTNAVVCRSTGIKLSTLSYWKRKWRAAGIEIKHNYSNGRPKKVYKHCVTCGQKIK